MIRGSKRWGVGVRGGVAVAGAAAMLAAVAGGGCLQILGDDVEVVLGTGGAGGTGTAGSTGVAGSSGSTGTGTGACESGEKQSCYSGPPDTKGVAMCAAGEQTCKEDGSGFGECLGEVLPGKETCASTEDEDCDGADCAIWSTIWGDAGDVVPLDIALDPSGNVLILARLMGSATVAGEVLSSQGVNGNPLLVKVEADGSPGWAVTFGDAAMTDFDARIAVDGAGRIVIAGMFDGAVTFGGATFTSAGDRDIFVAKLGADGSHLWSRQFGDTGSQAAAGVAVDSSGDVVLVGNYFSNFNIDGNVLTNEGSSDVFVAKLDANGGTYLWARSFGDNSPQWAKPPAVDSKGDILLAGLNAGIVNFGDGPLEDTSPGASDLFVAKLDGISGDCAWSSGYSVDQSTEITSVEAGDDDRVLLGGYFSGPLDLGGEVLNAAGQSDAFVAVLAADGTHVWSSRFGAGAHETLTSIAAAEPGAFVLGVSGNGTVDFGGGPLQGMGGEDTFIVKLGTEGQHIWSRRFGDAGDQVSPLLAAAKDGSIVAACDVDGSINFGDQELSGTGKTDTAVARLAP